MFDFTDINFAAFAVKLAKAVIAVLMAIAVMTLVDQRQKHSFSQSMMRIASDPVALSIYYGVRNLGICLLLGMLMGCASAQAATPFPTKYDRQVKEAVELYWPSYSHPAAWKAQLWQESRLNPMAVSPVGARGLAQFMPGTWAEEASAAGVGSSVTSDAAILVGARYMARLARTWRSERPTEDRWKLARASYNAGPGSLLKAQDRCGGPPLYADIVACLPAVTGARFSAETIGYVKNIDRWRAQMEAGL